MPQLACFVFSCSSLFDFEDSILTNRILLMLYFLLDLKKKNSACFKNNIILVKPAIQLWYPVVSLKSLSNKRGKLLTLL